MRRSVVPPFPREWNGAYSDYDLLGIFYEPASDSVLLSLSDASFYHFDLTPSLALATSAPTSYTLTSNAREIYLAAHRTGPDAKPPSRRLGERIMGFAVLGGAERDLAWIAECVTLSLGERAAEADESVRQGRRPEPDLVPQQLARQDVAHHRLARRRRRRAAARLPPGSAVLPLELSAIVPLSPQTDPH